jgi:hypothetical protein
VGVEPEVVAVGELESQLFVLAGVLADIDRQAVG